MLTIEQRGAMRKRYSNRPDILEFTRQDILNCLDALDKAENIIVKCGGCIHSAELFRSTAIPAPCEGCGNLST